MKIQDSGKRYAIAVLNESGAFLGFVPDLFPTTFPNHALRFHALSSARMAVESVWAEWANLDHRLIPWDMEGQCPAEGPPLRDEETREPVSCRPCAGSDVGSGAEFVGYLESLSICLEVAAARLRTIARGLDRRPVEESP